MKKLSEQEQLLLRNNAKIEVQRLEQIFKDDATTQLLNQFKNKYNICESVYKIILAEHQKRKGKSVSNHLTVTMKQVPFAFSFAGYGIDNDLLKNLFGTKSANGKSVKKLRDAITHGIDPKAVNEIQSRQTELFNYMNLFLEIIKTYDNVAA